MQIMLKLKEVLNLTNKYIVLATPLILFSLISNVYLISSSVGRLINVLIVFLLLTLMSSAFVAGWFTMIKKAVNDEYPENPNLLLRDFVSGVGEYFLPAAGAMVCLSVFSTVLIVIAYIVGYQSIGDIGITAEQLSEAMKSNEALKLFLTSLSPEQIIKINLWNLLLLSTMAGIYFLQIFYFPALFYKNKNPLIAMITGFKDLFSRKFFKVLLFVVLLLVIYLLLSALSALSAHSTILHFIVTLLNFYFIVFLNVGIFYFYNNNFVKIQLGQNIDIEL